MQYQCIYGTSTRVPSNFVSFLPYYFSHNPPPPSHPSQPEWLVRFPMVKAAVKAMDAMQQFATKNLPEKKLSLDYFTVAGASKRGWTTWLVGAVDPSRVMLIVPVVLDAINFVDVMHHQYRSYNGWSFALQDYLDMSIMQRLDTPNMKKLQEMEDPFMYASRLTMPKLVVNAVLDEFQQPDDNLFWWSGMPEPKHILMVPNAEHSMATGLLEAVPAIGAWISQHLRDRKEVPTFTWTIAADGTITATLDARGEVEEARAWSGLSCGQNVDSKLMRKDFRVISVDNPCTCGVASNGDCINLHSFWTKTVLQAGSNAAGHRTYTYKAETPTDGRYVASMIEIVYKKTRVLDEPEEAASSVGRALSAVAAASVASFEDKVKAAEAKAEAALAKASAKASVIESDIAKAREIVEALKHAKVCPCVYTSLTSLVTAVLILSLACR